MTWAGRYTQHMVESFSLLAPTYDDLYSTRADLADSSFIFGRARRLASRGPDGLFIDLGCGPGTALHWNVAPWEAYHGIDPAPGMVEEALQRWPGWSFQLGDHRDIPHGTAFVLGAFGPLQYVHPLYHREFATAVVEALLPGGRFLIMARPRPTPTREIGDDRTFGVSSSTLHGYFDLRGVDDLRVSTLRHAVSRQVHAMSRQVQMMSLRLERLFPLLVGAPEWWVIEGRKA